MLWLLGLDTTLFKEAKTEVLEINENVCNLYDKVTQRQNLRGKMFAENPIVNISH